MIPAALRAGDDTIREAVVREGKTTRSIAVRPFSPLRSLERAMESLPPMNRAVVTRMLAYPRDGHHDYWWPKRETFEYDGCTTDIVLCGRAVMKGEPRGRTFCCGLTLEVAYGVLRQQARLPDSLTSDSAALFKDLWFCAAIGSPGPVEAVEALGIGRRVPLDDARPGDFVQLWRHNKSGHSVIFVGWARNSRGSVIGLHYWSTQPATKGIGFHTEVFGRTGAYVDRARTTAARLAAPERWKMPPPATVAGAAVGH